LDYAVALALIVVPLLLGFEGAALLVPLLLGMATIGYSLVTAYELGAVAAIPFRAHLVLDFLNGALLAASPWLFGFAAEVFWPHLLAGLLELAVTLASIGTRPLRATESTTADDALTSDRLRHEIDSGRTGDKVDHPDPAAAPLGTDDEAAGTPPSRAAIRAALRAETTRGTGAGR
jgi:hypothetical protein